MRPHGLPRPRAEPSAEFRVLHELDDPLRCLGDGLNQEAIDAILDLMRDATGSATDHCRALPHRFGDGEAEALAH